MALILLSDFAGGFRSGAGFRHPSHTGRLNQKRLPCPGWLSTPYRPPWSSTIPRTMESPSPVPTAARLWALSTL